jgi:hypothetical protein
MKLNPNMTARERKDFGCWAPLPIGGQNYIWQNHAAPSFLVLPAMILSLLRMILSCHDSVFFPMVAASPRYVNRGVLGLG